MGQILIRNLDDRIIEALKRRAAAAGRSMEAEAREVLTRTAHLPASDPVQSLRAIRQQNQALRAPGRPVQESWHLLREDRDADDR